MTMTLRAALLDLVWAHNLPALQASYRQLENEPLQDIEREVAAVLFTQLVHVWTVGRTSPEQNIVSFQQRS
jgi:hypothetical protein